jgi:hypothetical protein
METGSHDNDWGSVGNDNFDKIDTAIGGISLIAVAGGTKVLTDDEARPQVLQFSGGLASNQIVEVPARAKTWILHNATTSGDFTLSVKTDAGEPVVIPRGQAVVAYCDGASILLIDVRVIGGKLTIKAGGADITGDTKITGKLEVTDDTKLLGGIKEDVSLEDGDLTLVAGGIRQTGSLDDANFTNVNWKRSMVMDQGSLFQWLKGGQATSVGYGVTADAFHWIKSTTDDHTQTPTTIATLSTAGLLELTNVKITSDARIKENVETIEGALAKVMRMRGVRFLNTLTGTVQLGVIAQEMRPIAPEVVHGDEEQGRLSVSLADLAGVFIEAFKELNVEVKYLRSLLAE